MASDNKKAGWLGNILADRIILTAILACAMIVAMGLVRSDSEDSGIAEGSFWRMKASWQGWADIVIPGDSRVYRAISPEEMNAAAETKTIQKLRIANYGFSGGGFDREYLDAIERVLDVDGARVIVLGITPHSLTDKAVKENGFIESRKNWNGEKNYDPPEGSDYDGFFARMTIKKFWRTIRMKKPDRFYPNCYHKDGWISGTRVPHSPEKALKPFADVFSKHKVSTDIEDEVFQAVKRWKTSGITVAAFRVPTCEAMVELENRTSGFDEQRFIRKFTAVGGVWIALDQTAYKSYDASHLHSNMPHNNGFPDSEHFLYGAEKLSRDLADALIEKGLWK